MQEPEDGQEIIGPATEEAMDSVVVNLGFGGVLVVGTQTIQIFLFLGPYSNIITRPILGGQVTPAFSGSFP